MAIDLAAEARERGIRYFLISFTDLYGTQRSKLVPAAAIAEMGAREPVSQASQRGWT